jgi:hypothetical protein
VILLIPLVPVFPTLYVLNPELVSSKSLLAEAENCTWLEFALADAVAVALDRENVPRNL